MDKYIVVTNEDLEDFANEVNERLEEGYIPKGGICHCVWVETFPYHKVKEEWSQGMIKW